MLIENIVWFGRDQNHVVASTLKRKNLTVLIFFLNFKNTNGIALPYFKVFDCNTLESTSLYGHTDHVCTIATSRANLNLLASSSKVV